MLFWVRHDRDELCELDPAFLSCCVTDFGWSGDVVRNSCREYLQALVWKHL